MGRNKFVMEVYEVKGHCPIYKKGDKVVIEPILGEDVSMVNMKETHAICPRTFGTELLSYFMWYEYATPGSDDEKKFPWENALGPSYFRCPEVGEPYSRTGYVVFKIYGVPVKEEKKLERRRKNNVEGKM